MLKVKSGDLDKMGLLFERYNRPLYGFLFRMCGESDSSEDMVQNVFYRMLKYRHSFTGEGEFITWMYHLARNVLNDEFKKNKKHRQQLDVKVYEESIAGGKQADEDLHKTQEAEAVQEAMNALSDEYREVLILSRYQELKYAEIAQILNITEGNVKVKVHRALKQLQAIYFKENENSPPFRSGSRSWG